MMIPNILIIPVNLLSHDRYLFIIGFDEWQQKLKQKEKLGWDGMGPLIIKPWNLLLWRFHQDLAYCPQGHSHELLKILVINHDEVKFSPLCFDINIF